MPTPAEALRKAAFALSQAAHKLERAVEENTRLRGSLADFAPVVVTSPTLPIPIELSRPFVGGISTLSIRGARWSTN